MKLRNVQLSLALAVAAFASTLALPTSPALAQAAPPSTSTAVERANADAVARLYARISAEQVADVPVSQIVDGVGGYAIMIGGLGRAEQVGGPRQVADDVVQVRLQISGARAAQLLLQAVAARPDRSPVPPDRLAFHLRMWSDRTFTSTGDSLPPAAMAVSNDATSKPADGGPDQAYVATQGAPKVENRSETPVVWRRAPRWVTQPINARATAPSVGSPLRTARVAERSAREMLRAQILALPLSDDGIGGKLSDHVEGRPEVAAAVEEAVTDAKVSGVDYRGDGSVEVRVAASADRLWQRLSAPPAR